MQVSREKKPTSCLIWFGSIGLLLFVGMLLAYLTGISYIPDRFLSSFASGIQTKSVNQVVIFLTNLNSPSALLFYAIALGVILLYFRKYFFLLFTVLSIWGSAIVVSVVKVLVARSRPLDRIVPIDSPSFPSWHATTSMSLALVLCLLLWPRLGKHAVWLLLWPLLIGASRIYLNAHWASDVIAGWGLGAFIATTIAVLLYKELTDERKEHSA
ncbi:phosphatase PAP2 family protein [Nitratifractor sp.]